MRGTNRCKENEDSAALNLAASTSWRNSLGPAIVPPSPYRSSGQPVVSQSLSTLALPHSHLVPLSVCLWRTSETSESFPFSCRETFSYLKKQLPQGPGRWPCGRYLGLDMSQPV